MAVLANLDSAGFFVALHEGLFAQEGLKVHYMPAFNDSITADTDSGATNEFLMQGYAVTKAWAEEYPNTLKAFNTALQAGQQRFTIEQLLN